MDTYSCKRCGYTTKVCANYVKHLHLIKPCLPILEDIPIEVLLTHLQQLKNRQYKYKCDYCDKTFKTPQNKYQHKQLCKKRPQNESVDDQLTVLQSCVSNTVQENIKLKQDNMRLKQEVSIALSDKTKFEVLYYECLRNGKRTEKTYQDILEKYYGHGHKKLACGVTDITTDTFHGEIKAWNCWKEAIGQLHCYNSDLPRAELHVYLFGEYSPKSKKIACSKLLEQGFSVYEFRHEDTYISLINLKDQSKTKVWQGLSEENALTTSST